MSSSIVSNFSIGSSPYYSALQEGIERGFSNLSVIETRPTLSNIDIYWESSTSGLINDLNNTISFTYYPIGFRDSAGNDTFGGSTLQYIHNENMAINTDLTLNFQLVNFDSNIISSDSVVSINSVIDGRQNNRTSEFKIVPVGTSGNTFKIQSNDFFTFTEDSNVNESYTFNLLASDNSGSSYFTDVPLVIKNCTLQNSAPNWSVILPASTSVTRPVVPSPFNSNDIKVFEFNVSSLTNGSASGGSEGLRLSLLNVGTSNPPPGASQFYLSLIHI